MFQQNFYDYSSWNVFLWPFSLLCLGFCFGFVQCRPTLLRLQQILWWQYHTSVLWKVLFLVCMRFGSLKNAVENKTNQAIKYYYLSSLFTTSQLSNTHKRYCKHKIYSFFSTYKSSERHGLTRRMLNFVVFLGKFRLINGHFYTTHNQQQKTQSERLGFLIRMRYVNMNPKPIWPKERKKYKVKWQQSKRLNSNTKPN